MPWTTLEFTDGLEALIPILDIKKAFEKEIADKPDRHGQAIFSRRTSGGVGLSLFFNPGTEDFAKNYQARPCPLPTGDLAIFAGDPNALKALKLSAQ